VSAAGAPRKECATGKSDRPDDAAAARRMNNLCSLHLLPLKEE